MTLFLKRVYEQPAAGDGYRILIDRLWPRGLTKEAARVDLWAKEVAPSADLRRWFDHRPERWDEFRERFRAELDERPGALDILRDLLAQGDVTLVFGSKEERYNNASALKEFLEADD